MRREKRKFSIVLAALALFSLSGNPNVGLALDFPKAHGFVNDFANILLPEEEAVLEQTLKNFERETSNEIVVAIVSTLGGLDRFSYSQELFTAWKVGKAGRNNGILFLIAPQERQFHINVGYGLEGAMPDSLTGSVLRNEVAPLFKEGKYFEGTQNGLTAIMAATKGEYKAIPGKSAGGGFWNFFGSMGGQLFIIFLIQYFCSFLARTKSWWLGGAIGTGAAGLFGFFAASLVTALILIPIFGGFGLLLDYILSKNYEARKIAGKSTDFWHSGGGFWWGGGSGGFGGGGGGFGGFGGGRSGGGGAGGSW